MRFVSTCFVGKSFLLIESYKAPTENCHNEENQSYNFSYELKNSLIKLKMSDNCLQTLN